MEEVIIDTQEAIQVLTSMKSTVNSNEFGSRAQGQALDYALGIINETLKLQLVQLENKYVEDITFYKFRINVLTGEKDDLVGKNDFLFTEIKRITGVDPVYPDPIAEPTVEPEASPLEVNSEEIIK